MTSVACHASVCLRLIFIDYPEAASCFGAGLLLLSLMLQREDSTSSAAEPHLKSRAPPKPPRTHRGFITTQTAPLKPRAQGASNRQEPRWKTFGETGPGLRCLTEERGVEFGLEGCVQRRQITSTDPRPGCKLEAGGIAKKGSATAAAAAALFVAAIWSVKDDIPWYSGASAVTSTPAPHP